MHAHDAHRLLDEWVLGRVVPEKTRFAQPPNSRRTRLPSNALTQKLCVRFGLTVAAVPLQSSIPLTRLVAVALLCTIAVRMFWHLIYARDPAHRKSAAMCALAIGSLVFVIYAAS